MFFVSIKNLVSNFFNFILKIFIEHSDDHIDDQKGINSQKSYKENGVKLICVIVR